MFFYETCLGGSAILGPTCPKIPGQLEVGVADADADSAAVSLDAQRCTAQVDVSNLVGGLELFLFFHILGIIIPTDQYFSEGLKPPTRWYITKCNGLSWSIIEYTGM